MEAVSLVLQSWTLSSHRDVKGRLCIGITGTGSKPLTFIYNSGRDSWLGIHVDPTELPLGAPYLAGLSLHRCSASWLFLFSLADPLPHPKCCLSSLQCLSTVLSIPVALSNNLITAASPAGPCHRALALLPQLLVLSAEHFLEIPTFSS